MELGTIVASYVAIIVGICTIANFLDAKPTIFKSKLISMFKKSRSSDIVKLSEVFIITFNYFYCKKNFKSIKRQNYLWAWLIISFIVTLGLGLISSVSGQRIELLAALIIGLLIGTELFILYIIFLGEFGDTVRKLISLRAILFSWINPPNDHPLNIQKWTVQPTIKSYLLITYIMALFSAIAVFVLGILCRFIYKNTELLGIPPELAVFEINIYLLVSSCIFLFIMSFYLFLFCSIIYYVITKYPTPFEISPIRTIITSLIAIGLLALLFDEAAYAFITDFEQFGWIILIYLFLNIFADSFSILETHYVLQIASLGTPKRFPGLLALDVLASGFIFLIIPLTAGNLNIFLDAICFKGDSPWLGILFWSTFSTSACFYLYLISFYVLATLHRYSIIDEKHLPITTKPFWSLGVVAIIIVTIAFIIGFLSTLSTPSSVLVAAVFILIIISVRWYFKKIKPSISSNK